MENDLTWICSQLGARENYAIPRALFLAGHLDRLYTDIWALPSSVPAKLNAQAAGRNHKDLTGANITSFNGRFLLAHARAKLSGKPADTDNTYDERVAKSLSTEQTNGKLFFAYSYSCRRSMKAAKAKGLTTFLGQINPGPAEADIVREEFKKRFGNKYKPTIPDDGYWNRWRQEVEAADHLIVNSEWSLKLLERAGIDRNKLHVVPLAYEPGGVSSRRQFPRGFGHESPLRLLYLGGIGLRKGFHILIDAMTALKGLPVTLDVVGGLKGPKELLENLPENVTVHGHVQRALANKFFDESHALVFPTLSDGFGLTQLEAQAARLPVIVSANCAQVIKHMQNGVVLSGVNEKAIVDAITQILDRPDLLPLFSENSISMNNYSISMLGSRLTNLAQT
jgi:glycosyltransferase involved in cell wall biosynthesis